MRWGIINVFCQMCGRKIRLNTTCSVWHSKDFGYLCNRECYELSQLKYARMILGKDDVVEDSQTGDKYEVSK